MDATHVRQKIFYATLQIPARPGPMTLYYPKWLPADHSPDGPIASLAGLQFSADGKEIPWRQDLDDMYTFHIVVPPAASAVTVHLAFLLSAPGGTIDFSAAASSQLMILMWNEVLLYPSGWPVHQLTYVPTLRLPPGWSFHTALPIAGQAGDEIRFKPVALDLLVDSPVQAGHYTRALRLNPGQAPAVSLDIAADDAWALNLPPGLIAKYRALVAQARTLYRSYHYRDYHFLLTLSNNVLPLGQEHHESSDDRVPERTFASPSSRLLAAGLLSHEYTHSWNGQYRRPAGLATPDFQQPMRGNLLWVYEGLTQYLSTVLSARSGLRTPAETRDYIASVAATLSHRAGAHWRSLQNTADAAQILYFAPRQWTSMRRGTDFYSQSVLLWLGVDSKIRSLTGNRRSLDDFCRLFLSGHDGEPIIVPYDFKDLVGYLNRVAPFDWAHYLNRRLNATSMALGLRSLEASGWRLSYDSQPNLIRSAAHELNGGGNFTDSVGLVVNRTGEVIDVVPGMSAFAAGLSPYMRITGINGRAFSVGRLRRAIAASSASPRSIVLAASESGTLAAYHIDYRGGIRYPHLEREPGTPDYLAAILKPLPSVPASQPPATPSASY